MLTYTEEKDRIRYGKLDKGGATVSIVFSASREVLRLDAIRTSDKIAHLISMIWKKTGVHPARQRLFIGGERMDKSAPLADYFPTLSQIGECELELRCFIPLLISAQACPGSMLTEIEVRPRSNEPVIEVKRRIRDKFRIEIPQQRLYLHPAEMTTLSRRQELESTRLFSCYLSPGVDGNFLELLPHNPKSNSREIFIRIPKCVINAIEMEESALKFSQQLHHSKPPAECKEFLEVNIPPPPPQTPEDEIFKYDPPAAPEEHLEDWWITIPINLDDVIKRDPSVDDVKQLVLRAVGNVKGVELKIGNLKFATAKVALGGLNLSGLMFGDSQVRSEEMLIYIEDPNLDLKMNKLPRWYGGKRTIPAANPLTPLHPLTSYSGSGIRFTTPPDQVLMTWNIDPCAPLDLGAFPGISLELTGVSFAKRYGSWDIPEHEKLYVEVIAEGTMGVCDVALRSSILNDAHGEQSRLDYDVDVIRNDVTTNEETRGYFYVHDSTEITLLGPVNKAQVGSKMGSTPFFPDPSWSVERRRKSLLHDDLRKGQYGNPLIPLPAPLRIQNDPSCLITSSGLDPMTSSWEDRRQFSETIPGQWYLSRERVSDVSTPEVTSSGVARNAFSTSCKRGVSIDGRPYVTMTYRRNCEVTSQPSIIDPRSNYVDSFRKSLDFRVQAQFYLCHLISEGNSQQDAESFSIKIRQNVSRVQFEPHTPDIVTQFTSPPMGTEKTFDVKLATARWRQTNDLPEQKTIDLNK